MELIKAAPGIVFWWGWFMVALLAGGALYATWWARRNIKAIVAQNPKDVSSLTDDGFQLAWGHTVGPALMAPLTGRACVWWKVQVFEMARDLSPSGKSRHVWREVASEESDRPILFGNDKSIAAIWPYGATIVSSHWSDWRGTKMPPEDRCPKLHTFGAPPNASTRESQGLFGLGYRYIEQTLPAESPLFALGDVTRTDQEIYASDEIDEADGEAEADGYENWRPEVSRLGVTATPDKTIADDMSRAEWTVSAAKGKPFLISIEHPEAVSAEMELAAKGGLVMGGICTGVAIVLLWFRFGG